MHRAVDLRTAWERAERGYLQALHAPPSEQWLDAVSTAMEAAHPAGKAWDTAEQAKLAPLKAVLDAVEAASDAFYEDVRAHK